MPHYDKDVGLVRRPRRRKGGGPSPSEVRKTAHLLYFESPGGPLRREQIANELGISSRTLARWQTRADVEEVYAAISEAHSKKLTAEWLAEHEREWARLEAIPQRYSRSRRRWRW